MSSFQEFITKFHNLSGLTIGERRKHLFILLDGYKNCADEWDFKLIQPQNFLEEKFKVDVLIYFKRVTDLIDVLKSEKPYLISRILRLTRNRWFFDAFCKIGASELTTVVFPNISFKLKVKLINKLTMFLSDADQAECYFEAIREKYGFYLAAKLLPSCSSHFIVDFLRTHKFKPTGKQVLIIVKRYPHISEEILEIVMHKCTYDNYLFVFQHIAKYDSELFLKLNRTYSLQMRLGWRLTGKFVQMHKDEVIGAPRVYYRVLHNRTIAKTLNRNFPSMFINLFPEKVEKFKGSGLFSILKRVPARMNRVNLLLSTFEEKYGNSFWSYSSLLSLELMDLLPLEERQKRVSIENKPGDIKEECWVCYLPTQKSLPYLKHKISLSSAMQTRARLVDCLVLTCKLNSDTTALLEVCSYIFNKHRNDSVKVRESFLKGLTMHFELEKLSNSHWNLINQLVNLSFLNGENLNRAAQIKEAYIHYRLLHNLPVRDELTEWIQHENSNLIIIKSNPEFSKSCLLTFGEIIDEMEDERFETWAWHFINGVICWNNDNRIKRQDQSISILRSGKIEALLKRRFASDDFNYKDVRILVYCIQYEVPMRKQYFDIYLSLTERYGQYDIFNWLMRYDLPLVVGNIETITPIVLKDYNSSRSISFFKLAKNLSHLDVPQKLTALCTDSFSKTKNLNAVLALSFLKDSSQLVELIRQYYPIEREANYKTPEGRELYALQEVIGMCLANLNPPSVALESLLIFCKGDFLKLVRSSLYSIVDNVNENKLVPFFSELITRAVSTRKHALHLTFRVLDKAEVYTIIKRFMEKEKNASLRKFIFKICFNFFVINPEEFTWELVTLNLNAVDIDDREAMEVLLQIDKVPHDYIVTYISLVWKVLHAQPDPDDRWQRDKLSVLQSISPNLISKIPGEFFDNVISLYFLKCDSLTHFASVVNGFVCKYILYCDDGVEQRRRLTSCFDIVKDYVTKSWNDPVRRTPARNTAIDFLKEFCAPFLSGHSNNREIFTNFERMWNTMLKPHETFDEYLHLKLTYLVMELNGSEKLALNLESLCDTLVSNYGQVVIGMLCKKINFFSRYFFKSDEASERYSLIFSLIHDGSSVSCLILAIFLLNNCNPTKVDLKMKYGAIIEKLEKYKEPVIEMYLSSHVSGNTNLFYT
ncbi:hypothetical protein RI129_008111 [Pyrocoelia pectoralis]|uniref:Uncharacterized protein n=1 Tax=Pyrocoelia pectoralis TaxID=417401 RepID=A0AAN7VFP3_9COLE